MNPSLHDQLLDRLTADAKLPPAAAALVDAACTGDGALAEAIAGKLTVRPAPATERRDVPGAWLSRLAVRGFRGIGPEVAVDLDPGPGLTLVIGRNGSGKSSLAEGLEMLLTGTNRRWEGRTKEWKEGWRNLHEGQTSLEATFLVEGEVQPVTVRRTWTGADLDDSSVAVLRGTAGAGGMEVLGWAEPLSTYRPFLSYNELGALLEAGPSKLYDQLKGILGLDEVTAASARLRQERLKQEKVVKEARRREIEVVALLTDLDDPRARACLDALDDLAAVERMVLGGSDDGDLGLLRERAGLRVPEAIRVIELAERLRQARADREAIRESQAAQADATGRLLHEALAFHETWGEADCPVCGEGTLDADWRARALARTEALDAAAARAREAQAAVDQATKAARELLRPPPPAVLGTDAEAPWRAWAQGGPDRIEETHGPLEAAVGALRTEAAAELARRQDRWRPVAKQVAAWLEHARAAERTEVAQLKEAEKWLKGAEADLQNARFEPIAEHAQRLWATLRQESHVDLAKVSLSRTQRRVELNVTVDGADTVALGVMSQGEVHALALSLFLPRMTLEESPFRFVVVDDPVQSMDPHKVDGLARVLAETARTRQVVVFTHDTRLEEAVRRMRIEARVLRVERRGNSGLDIRVVVDPVQQHLADARQILRAEEVGPDVARRVVPTFCRLALEAQLARLVRRRCLRRGDPHARVEEALRDARTLTTLAALALHDDARAGGKVMATLNRDFGSWAGDLYKALQRGAHGHETKVAGLVGLTEDLTRRLERAS